MYTKRNYRNKRNKLHLSYNVIKNEQYFYICSPNLWFTLKGAHKIERRLHEKTF